MFLKQFQEGSWNIKKKDEEILPVISSHRGLNRAGKTVRLPRSLSDFTLRREIHECFTAECVTSTTQIVKNYNQSFPSVLLGNTISNKKKKLPKQ